MKKIISIQHSFTLQFFVFWNLHLRFFFSFLKSFTLQLKNCFLASSQWVKKPIPIMSDGIWLQFYFFCSMAHHQLPYCAWNSIPFLLITLFSLLFSQFLYFPIGLWWLDLGTFFFNYIFNIFFYIGDWKEFRYFEEEL